MEKINQYGWKSYVSLSDLDLNQDNDDNIGRVISIKGHTYELITNQNVLHAELLGRLLVEEKEEQPKVGDWVKFLSYEADKGYISEVLPRINNLYRKSAGREYSKQILVTNVDFAVVVQGLDQDFNLNRLERYLVQIATCGIPAVVVLNKSDLVDNSHEYVQWVQKLGRGVTVYTCSTKSGVGISGLLHNVFKPQIASVLVGSSGVGKSSLINALNESEERTFGAVSESTSKGRHTTTTRDMLLLENGGIIIDTPGMREFGLGFEDDGVFSEQFPLINEYAQDCRFSDCSHTGEVGCAVIDAFERGDLEAIVYENYLKLISEQKRFQTSEAEKRKEGRQFGKMARGAQEIKRRLKGK